MKACFQPCFGRVAICIEYLCRTFPVILKFLLCRVLVVSTPDFGNTLNNILTTRIRVASCNPDKACKTKTEKMNQHIFELFLNYSAVNPKSPPGFLDISMSNGWHVLANNASNMDAN